jgi:iron complex transport system ATP-binding protein
MTSPALRIRNLFVAYGNTPVLRGIDMDVPEGKFSVLLGKNGCGKSTLFKAAAGLLPLNKGRVEIRGKDLSRMPLSEKARQIGYLPQFHHPVFPFSVQAVVLTGRAAYVFSNPGRRDKEKAMAAMEETGIQELKERPYTELSGGERQLVMIARLLAQEPKVILLDEPFTHLDLANQVRLLELIQRLVARGLTVWAVVHDPNIAFFFSENVGFLAQGTVHEPPAGTAPWDPEVLARVYGTTLEIIPYRGRSIVLPGPNPRA